MRLYIFFSLTWLGVFTMSGRADNLVPLTLPTVPESASSGTAVRSGTAATSGSATTSGTAISGTAISGTTAASGSTTTPLVSATASASTQVVDSTKLLPFFPAAPAGWSAEKADGITAETDEMKLTTASRTYHKGNEDDAPLVTMTIIDFAGNQDYFEAVTGTWKPGNETAEGYDKVVDLDGVRGFEHYAKIDKGSSLAFIVARRFFVQIELDNQDPKELRTWFKKLDIKKLEKLR